MRPERSFGSYRPEVIPFRAAEPIRIAGELEQFIAPWEVILFSRTNEEKSTEALHQEPRINQTDGPVRTPVNGDWEPFSQEPAGDNRFLNFYNGNYSQDMEINRKRAEQAIKVAGLEGNIILTSLSYSRTRSIEANPDGSVAGKRGLFWGEKPEDSENPYHRVTSIPEGWRVEICDQRIRDELSEKYSGEKLQQKFVAAFNQHLRSGIREAVWKEKLTTKKDEDVRWRYALDAFIYCGLVAFEAFDGLVLSDLKIIVPKILVAYPAINIILRRLSIPLRATLDSPFDYFMPSFIGIDRILRGWAYLNLKGRNLARLR